jgi:hypothetical protein
VLCCLVVGCWKKHTPCPFERVLFKKEESFGDKNSSFSRLLFVVFLSVVASDPTQKTKAAWKHFCLRDDTLREHCLSSSSPAHSSFRQKGFPETGISQ